MEGREMSMDVAVEAGRQQQAEAYPKAPRQKASARLPLPWLLPAVAGGVLLWLCFFPAAWGWLAWVALVPMLCLVRSAARPVWVYLGAVAAGLAFFLPALFWMYVAIHLWMRVAWVLLAVYCSLYFLAAVFLMRRLDRGTRLPLVVTVPVVWTGLEFLRAYLLSGFPWYYLGHTQHRFLLVIQVADVTGAYGVSFLVAAVNALAFTWLVSFLKVRRFLSLVERPAATSATNAGGFGAGRGLAVQTAVLAGLLGMVLGYGAVRLGQEEFTPGPRVALLQSCTDDRLGNKDGAENAPAGKFSPPEDLCAVASRLSPRPDLIVWPENSYIRNRWWELSPEVLAAPMSAERRRAVEAFHVKIKALQAQICAESRAHGTSLLLGLESFVFFPTDEQPRRYNSALFILADGRVGGRYDKIHRVPFGEFVPLRDLVPLMDVFNPYGYDFSISPGKNWVRLPLDKYRFGVLICYEDTDPSLTRDYGAHRVDGPAVDFLVNISNDGWFDGSSEHDEHLAICRFRAIETRRPVVRSVNMGISAVIDGNGRVLQPELVGEKGGIPVWEIKDSLNGAELEVGEWHWFKKVQGVLVATIPLDGRTSLYARWGDWLPWGCWLVVAGGLIWALWSRLRRPAIRTA
jgi:apolipoprotein N-acyltransferase